MTEKSKKENNGSKLSKAYMATTGAVVAGRGVPGKLLGYHTVHHGTTSTAAANNIREKGLKKSKGGTGISRNDDAQKTGGRSNNVNRSKGHIYITKKAPVASHYTKNMFGMPNGGNIITARIPHDHYAKKAKLDTLSARIAPDRHFTTKGMKKDMAAKSSKSIPPSQIERSSKYKGRKQYATKKNMKKYLSSKSGAGRFAAGVVQAGAAAGGLYYAAKKLKEMKSK